METSAKYFGLEVGL